MSNTVTDHKLGAAKLQTGAIEYRAARESGDEAWAHAAQADMLAACSAESVLILMDEMRDLREENRRLRSAAEKILGIEGWSDEDRNNFARLYNAAKNWKG